VAAFHGLREFSDAALGLVQFAHGHAEAGVAFGDQALGPDPLAGHGLVLQGQLNRIDHDAAGGEHAPQHEGRARRSEQQLTLGRQHELAHLSAGADVQMTLREKAFSRLAQARQALVDHAP
jgi:hypothetical protein